MDAGTSIVCRKLASEFGIRKFRRLKILAFRQVRTDSWRELIWENFNLTQQYFPT